MKKIFLIIIMVLVSVPAMANSITFEEAQNIPLCEVQDHNYGPLSQPGLYSGEIVVVSMEPSHPRNGERCRMNGRDIVKVKNILKHRVCHNNITDLKVINKPEVIIKTVVKTQIQYIQVQSSELSDDEKMILAMDTGTSQVSNLEVQETGYYIEGITKLASTGIAVVGGIEAAKSIRPSKNIYNHTGSGIKKNPVKVNPGWTRVTDSSTDVISGAICK